jgi:hypothetical protein
MDAVETATPAVEARTAPSPVGAPRDGGDEAGVPSGDPANVPGAVLAPAAVLGLQRSAGNAAVSTLLRAGRDPRPARPIVQRDDAPAANTAGGAGTATAGGGAAGGGGAPPPGADTALSSAQNIQGTATARLLKVAGYNTAADTSISAYRDKRTAYAAAWGAAWERHKATLSAASAEAANENLVEGVVIGVVASMVIAAVGAAVFPEAAAAAAFSGTWTAFNAGTSVVSGVGGTLAALPLAVPDPGGPKSGASDASADAWQAVSGVEDAARSVSAMAPRFGLELGNAEYAIAQVQAAIAGSKTDMNWDMTLQMVSTLMQWEQGVADFDGQIEAKLQGMMAFGGAVQAWPASTPDILEKEIWTAWLASLSDKDKDLLGHRLFGNAVHDKLVALGLLSDTWWVSDSDKDKAIAGAKAHVATAAAPPPPS